MTEIFQVESPMRLEVGGTKNYSEDRRRNELAVIDVTDPDKDKVVAIPESLLARGGDIRTPELPFALRVEKYLPNSAARRPHVGRRRKNQGQRRHRQALVLQPRAAHAQDGRRKQPGRFGPSRFRQRADWRLDRFHLADALSVSSEDCRTRLRRLLLPDASLPIRRASPSAAAPGRSPCAPVRYYKPYTITLAGLQSRIYPGTDIPKNFSSKIHLSDPATGEDRDILDLHEQSPALSRRNFLPGQLRAGRPRHDLAGRAQSRLHHALRGLQARRPRLDRPISRLHLVGFARKRAQAAKPVPARDPSPAPPLVPILANAARRQKE